MIDTIGVFEMKGSVQIPITDRARKYGYVVWPKAKEREVSSLLDGKTKIAVRLVGNDLGVKRIDWKYRRISLGYNWTRRVLTGKRVYVLSIENNGMLKVDAE